MVYDSQILFTLDTICPWTYLAKNRLDEALTLFRSSTSSQNVTFTIIYLPYQLHPSLSQTGEDKFQWYKNTKYNGSDEQMQKYTTLMSTYGANAGIEFDFHGTIANTLHAHRLIQHYQEERGAEVADKIVESLYRQYFTQRAHPSAKETLVEAAVAAGVERGEAEAFVENENERLQETKMAMREQIGNGVDSVPYIVIEGKRRDFTLQGAKEMGEYLKTLEAVVKEAS